MGFISNDALENKEFLKSECSDDGTKHKIAFGYMVSDALYIRVYLDGVYQKKIRCID